MANPNKMLRCFLRVEERSVLGVSEHTQLAKEVVKVRDVKGRGPEECAGGELSRTNPCILEALPFSKLAILLFAEPELPLYFQSVFLPLWDT